MNKLNGQRALITGASSGIGRAMAVDLAAKGVELFLLARREDRLRELKKEIPHAKVTLIVHDVNHKSLPGVIEKATGGELDILINNAGLALGRDKVEDLKFEDLEGMIETNVTANFRIARTVLPWMLRAQHGDIINICSIAGHVTYIGGSVYTATKHAVHAFTRVLREETAGRGVRVMQMSPGMVDTEFSTVRFRGDKAAADSVYAGMTPLRPEDISRMMVFMLEQPRHVVMDEIITMPQDQGSATTVIRR